MMEPLSIVASLLPILEATAVVCKTSIAFYHNVREAPQELAHVSTQISRTRVRLATQVRLYKELNISKLENVLPDEALETLYTDLETAKTCLESVQILLSAKTSHGNDKQHFSWIIRDKRKVNKLLDNLRDIDSNLSATLGTLSL